MELCSAERLLFPQGRGVWRDDEHGGYSIDAIDRQAVKLREFLVRMGKEASQGAVGVLID